MTGDAVQIAIDRLPVPTLVLAGERVTEANAAMCALLGGSAAQLAQLDITEMVHPDDATALRFALVSRTVDRVVVRLHERLNGTALELTIADTGDGRLCLVARDVSELLASRRRAEELQAELRRRALHDPLTGLPNRALLRQLVDESLSRHERFGYRFAVLFADLDGFKRVNDELGHEVGDQVLATVGRRFVELLGDKGVVARLGGDEFVVLTHDAADPASVATLAQRLIEVAEMPIPCRDVTASVTCSVGVSFPSPDDSTDALINRADSGMYRAKQQAPGRWQMTTIGPGAAAR